MKDNNKILKNRLFLNKTPIFFGLNKEYQRLTHKMSKLLIQGPLKGKGEKQEMNRHSKRL